MLYANKQQNPGLIAKFFSDTIPGIIIMMIGAKIQNLFSLDRLPVMNVKYFDKIHYLLLLIFNGYIVYYSDVLGEFDLSSFTIDTAILSAICYYAFRSGDPGVISPSDIESSTHLDKCKSCQAPKYLRSYHDPNTGACYFRFDHYNKYARVPVASRNYRSYIAFLIFQTLNLAALTPIYYDLMYKLMWDEIRQTSSIEVLISIIAFLFIFYVCNSLSPLLFSNLYKLVNNITANEVLNSREMLHISFDPYYENTFDKGYFSNVKQFLIGYKTEKEQWAQKILPRQSREFIGIFLQSGLSDQPVTEDVGDQNENIDIINAWLNQTNQNSNQINTTNNQSI